MITTQIDDLVGRPTGVKTQAFLYVLCGLAEAAVYVALLPLLRSLIAGDYVAAGYLVALAAALALLHSVIGFFADNRGYYIGIEQICHALQDALGDHIVRLPLGWFTKERSGQVAALLTKELQMAMDVPSTFLRQMVIAVTTPAAVVVLFLFVDWRIGLVFVIAAPLLLWASRAMAKAAGEGHRQEELSNAEVAARVLEFAHAQPVLRATKRSVEGWDALQQAIERDRAATVATLRMASAPVARYTMLIQVVFAVVFATATALLAWGQIDVASYVFVAVLSLRLVDPLTLIGSQGMALRVAKNALDASEGILKTPPLPETRNPRVPCGSSVVFDRVGFAYEESRPVLQGVSLTCPERSLTALVGPSGSGKTTLTRLVARFWDVSEGSVSIGGVDVRDMRPDELMQQISLVFQDVYLFDGTIEENVLAGRPDATPEEVRRAAHVARLDEVAAPSGAGMGHARGRGRLPPFGRRAPARRYRARFAEGLAHRAVRRGHGRARCGKRSGHRGGYARVGARSHGHRHSPSLVHHRRRRSDSRPREGVHHPAGNPRRSGEGARPVSVVLARAPAGGRLAAGQRAVALRIRSGAFGAGTSDEPRHAKRMGKRGRYGTFAL